MNPHLGKAAFHIAFFITFVAAGLLFFVERGTAEFGVTLLSLIVGLLFIGTVVVLVKRS